MVLEEIFKPKWLKHRPYMAFVSGFAFTFISFIVSLIFFRSAISVAMILLTTLLLIPTLTGLLRMEEQVERKYGIKHFFRNHKDIFEVYMFAFLGVFLACVVIGLGLYDRPAAYDSVFEMEVNFLSLQQGVDEQSVQGFVDGSVRPSIGRAASLFSHDLLVVLICFVLSFFYGAAAIFLIILNGSVFANFIVFVIKVLADNIAQGVQAFFFFLIHLVPEIAGFLLAAIAGGVVSKAVLHEKKGTAAFKNVFKDATLMMLIAILLVLVGTFLEVYVTGTLFQSFF